MKAVEQISSHEKGAWKRWLKRHTRRLLRREAKKDPDLAPLKPKFRGWTR